MSDRDKATARREPFAVDEYDVWSREPEALNVGQLNRVVRLLREGRSEREALLAEAGEALRLLLFGFENCRIMGDGFTAEEVETIPVVKRTRAVLAKLEARR